MIFTLCQLCVFEFKEFIFPLSWDELIPVNGEHKGKEFAGVSDHDHDIAVERKLQAHDLHVGVGQFIQLNNFQEGGGAQTSDCQGSISWSGHIHIESVVYVDR